MRSAALLTKASGALLPHRAVLVYHSPGGTSKENLGVCTCKITPLLIFVPDNYFVKNLCPPRAWRSARIGGAAFKHCKVGSASLEGDGLCWPTLGMCRSQVAMVRVPVFVNPCLGHDTNPPAPQMLRHSLPVDLGRLHGEARAQIKDRRFLRPSRSDYQLQQFCDCKRTLALF
jgi:hypothetical protein